MGRGRQLGWMTAAAMTAACATSAITDDPNLDWQPSIQGGLDGSASTAVGDDADAAVVAGDAGESTAEDDDAGLDAGQSSGESDASSGESDASSADAGRADAGRADAGRADAGRDDAGSVTPDASTAPDAASDDAGQPDCPSGTERCGSECVDTTSESEHCGGCNTVCDAEQVCTAGSCVDPAPTASNCTTKEYGDHDYLFCTGRSDDWVDARRQCINLGMDLGVPDDQAEQDFFEQNQAGKELWIGVNDRTTEGEFHAVRFGNASNYSGAQPSFHPWASGEPNNDKDCVVLGFLCTTDEDCAQLRTDGLWNDGNCANTGAYVCESY